MFRLAPFALLLALASSEASAQSFITVPRASADLDNLYGVDVIGSRQRGEGYTFGGIAYVFAPARRPDGVRDQAGGISYGFLAPALSAEIPLLVGAWGVVGVAYGCGAKHTGDKCDSELGWGLVNPLLVMAGSVGVEHRSILWQTSLGAAYTHGSVHVVYRIGGSFVWRRNDPAEGGVVFRR